MDLFRLIRKLAFLIFSLLMMSCQRESDMALYVNSTPIRKLKKDNTTLHSLKVNNTEVFNDEIVCTVSLYVYRDPNEHGEAIGNFTLSAVRKDSLLATETFIEKSYETTTPHIVTGNLTFSRSIFPDSRIIIPQYTRIYDHNDNLILEFNESIATDVCNTGKSFSNSASYSFYEN